MLVILAVVGSLCVLGALVIAKVAHAAMARLGLEFWSVMLWFGLAEALPDELAAKRAEPARRSRVALSRT